MQGYLAPLFQIKAIAFSNLLTCLLASGPGEAMGFVGMPKEQRLLTFAFISEA